MTSKSETVDYWLHVAAPVSRAIGLLMLKVPLNGATRFTLVENVPLDAFA